MKAIITMAGIPHHSSLIPYEIEIISLRRRRPPMPYAVFPPSIAVDMGLKLYEI